MELDHLIMQFFNSYLFIKIDSIGELGLSFFLTFFSLLWFKLKVNISLFDELFSKFSHTFRIFRFRVVTHDTGSPPRFADLLLRNDLRLWIDLGGVYVCSGFVGVAEDSTLKLFRNVHSCVWRSLKGTIWKDSLKVYFLKRYSDPMTFIIDDGAWKNVKIL